MVTTQWHIQTHSNLTIYKFIVFSNICRKFPRKNNLYQTHPNIFVYNMKIDENLFISIKLAFRKITDFKCGRQLYDIFYRMMYALHKKSSFLKYK